MKRELILRSIQIGSSFLALSAGNASATDTAAVMAYPSISNESLSTQDPDAPPNQPGASSEGKDIVVTGSRVISNGNNSPTPLTVLSTAKLQSTTPSNLPDALNKLPIFNNSSSQRTNNNSSSNGVGNYLNLRGLGTVRNLILFDGHRVPGTDTSGAVDANTIPQLLIERVDIVTGGASAVYGSDAVSGVINFVVDKKFTGVKMQAQSGVSGLGDNPSQRFGVAVGANILGGKGHIEASFEHYNNPGIGSKLDRRLGRDLLSIEGGGTAASPYVLAANTRRATFSYGGLILDGPLAGQQFAANGSIVPFVHGTPTGTVGIESGGDGTFFKSDLLASLRSDQLFVRLDYDLSSDVKLYAQVSATQSTNDYAQSQYGFGGATLSTSNAFLSTAQQAALSAGGATTFTINKTIDQDPLLIHARTRDILANVGLKGGNLFGADWEVSYSHAETEQRVTVRNNVSNARVAAALDAVVSPSGQIVCNVTITNPGLYPGCVPLNPFGNGSESAQTLAYISQPTYYTLSTKIDDVTASLHRNLGRTWAGPITVALSGEFRRTGLDLNSNADPTAHADCTGLRYNCDAATSLYFSTMAAPFSGSQSVVEGAVEVNVPLLRDLPFASALDLNAAARQTHYDTSGNATTWKLGLVWKLDKDLTLRATRSRDIRAPNVFELFSPLSINDAGFSDPHTNTAGNVKNRSQGNSSLKPEVANTLTVGAVYRPGWLRPFYLTIDYYDIRIGNAISQVSGFDASVLAQCEASGGTSPLCALYERPLPFSNRTAANFPISIATQMLNVATFRQKGIDTEVGYTFPIGKAALTLRGLASYTIEQKQRQFDGAPTIDTAGVATQPVFVGGLGIPKWRITGMATLAVGKFSLDTQTRWRSSVKQSGDTSLVFANNRVAAASFTDLTASYDIGESRKMRIFLSVQNLFDKQPPAYISTVFSSIPGFYYPAMQGDDVVGRYFTAGTTIKF